jgi:ABC-2 type transport system permease protein
VKKTLLLKTSPYSAISPTPHMVSLGTLYQEPDERSFNRQFLNVGVLLEGEFESVFKNRILPKSNSGENLSFKEKSVSTQMIVVSDGDVIRNQLNIVNPNIPKGTPLPLGFDQFTGQQYGNKDFLLNAMDYMLDETGLISIRSRELKLRLLNPQKVSSEKLYWQMFNTLIPIALIVVFGIIMAFLRRRKFT